MNKNFERLLINYLYFDINRMIHFVRDEIFEYDIQSSIHKFLMFKLETSKYIIAREKNGKVDHVIKDKQNDKTTLLEVKSFIKKRETFSYKKIKTDIEKTSRKINANNDTEGYLILVTKQSHLKSKDIESKEFINCITGKNKKISFGTIKTRIIRSFITTHKKNNEFLVHNRQVRIFMFQIIN